MRPSDRIQARNAFARHNGEAPAWPPVPYPGALEQLRRTGWVNAALDLTALCTGLGAILLLYVVM